jgi:hypothetical protein
MSRCPVSHFLPCDVPVYVPRPGAQKIGNPDDAKVVLSERVLWLEESWFTNRWQRGLVVGVLRACLRGKDITPKQHAALLQIRRPA